MANPSSISSGVGFRHIQIFALGTAGYPNASSPTTAYEGITISGAKVLTINDPEPIQVVHVGDDRPFALDVLPAKEPITGEMRTGKENNTVDAALQGATEFTVGESKMYPMGTDKKGLENQVGVLAYREAVDTDPASANYGQREWQFRIFPKCYVIPREAGFEDNPQEKTYTVRPQFVSKHLWGTTLSTATEGVTQMQGARGIAEYKPRIVAYLGNSVATSFTLPTAAAAASKISVWSNGTLTTTTNTTASVVFATAPTTNAAVVVWYETTA